MPRRTVASAQAESPPRSAAFTSVKQVIPQGLTPWRPRRVEANSACFFSRMIFSASGLSASDSCSEPRRRFDRVALEGRLPGLHAIAVLGHSWLLSRPFCASASPDGAYRMVPSGCLQESVPEVGSSSKSTTENDQTCKVDHHCGRRDSVSIGGGALHIVVVCARGERWK